MRIMDEILEKAELERSDSGEITPELRSTLLEKTVSAMKRQQKFSEIAEIATLTVGLPLAGVGVAMISNVLVTNDVVFLVYLSSLTLWGAGLLGGNLYYMLNSREKFISAIHAAEPEIYREAERKVEPNLLTDRKVRKARRAALKAREYKLKELQKEEKRKAKARELVYGGQLNGPKALEAELRS